MKEKNYKLSNNLIEYSRRAKILEKDEEYLLITQWRDFQNQNALQKILKCLPKTCHCLCPKIQ